MLINLNKVGLAVLAAMILANLFFKLRLALQLVLAILYALGTRLVEVV